MTMTTTQTSIATTCPPSEVMDQIVRWQDVRAGDLVLQTDELVIAERVETCETPWGDGTTFPATYVYHRLGNGVLVSNEHHGDRYTAVRRYVEAAR